MPKRELPVSKSETGAFFYHHSIPACFLRALNEVSLITCSILQASSVGSGLIHAQGH